MIFAYIVCKRLESLKHSHNRLSKYYEGALLVQIIRTCVWKPYMCGFQQPRYKVHFFGQEKYALKTVELIMVKRGGNG